MEFCIVDIFYMSLGPYGICPRVEVPEIVTTLVPQPDSKFRGNLQDDPFLGEGSGSLVNILSQ